MKLSAPVHPSVTFLASLIAISLPMVFTACGDGIVGSASTAQQGAGLTVASVVPDNGPPAGGKVVTIIGANFTTGTQQTSPSVTFGGAAATRVTVLSATQLNVVTPAHAAGTVTVKVTRTDGTSAILANAFTYISSSFALYSVSPLSGPAAGGTQVTISGSGFQSGAGVSFGGFPASPLTVSNSTTIKALTPTHSAGSVSVVVTNPNGQSATLPSGFTFHSVDLFWNPPTSTTVSIVGYNVYRATSSIAAFGKLNGPTPIGATSFNDVTVQGGTTYYYEVTSVDSSGMESAPVGPVGVTVSP